jgi:hypothetical protein
MAITLTRSRLSTSRGVQHLLGPDGIVLWHDYWLAGVSESVTTARQSGYRCAKVNSSCEMVFGTRDEAVFPEIQALFDDAETPRPRAAIHGRDSC